MDNSTNETQGNLKIEIAQETFKVLIDEDQRVEIYFISGGRMYSNSSPNLLYLVPHAASSALESLYDLPPSACPMEIHRLFFILPGYTVAQAEIELLDDVGITITRYNLHGHFIRYISSKSQ